MKNLSVIRIIISLILITVISLPGFGRSISGIVVSDVDSTLVAGASCRLISDSRQLLATNSDEHGRFELTTDNHSSLRLEVEAPGFLPTEVLIKQGSGNVDAGTIYLSQGERLDEVTVYGSTTIDRRGRTVIYPSQADVKASATSISLFEKLPLPGLAADPVNRSLSVDGGAPVILIDGVPSSLTELNAIKPSSIEKIEYTRIAPVRYAGSDAKGYLSVTLKHRDDGGDIYAFLRSATATCMADASINLSYHQGPSQFKLMYSPSWRNYQDVYDESKEAYIAPDFRVDLSSSDRDPFNYFHQPIMLKYNFVPSARTMFSATFNTTILTSKKRYEGIGSDSELGGYEIYNTQSSHDFTPSLDLFLRHNFSDTKTLEIDVVGTLGSNDYRRSNSYIYTDTDVKDYVMDVDSHRRSLISEINYSQEFASNTELSVGYQNMISHSRNTYHTTDYEPTLTDNNNYLYVNVAQMIGRIYLSAGTGLKMYWIKNDDVRRHFIRNVTRANASWRISDKWNITAFFMYSPSIPSLAEVTDYLQQINPYLYSNGAPDLKASTTYYYQISPSFRINHFSATLTVNYNDVKNAVVSNVTYMGDHKFLSQSENTRRYSRLGTSLNLTLSGFYGFGANLALSYVRYDVDAQNWSHQLNAFNGSMSLWWNKGPWTISYWRKFPAKSLSGYSVGREENGDQIGVDFKPNSHWTFTAVWAYMFEPHGTKYPKWNYSPVNPSYTDRYIKDNGNMVLLSAIYTADFGSLFRRSTNRNLQNSDTDSSILKR